MLRFSRFSLLEKLFIRRALPILVLGMVLILVALYLLGVYLGWWPWFGPQI